MRAMARPNDPAVSWARSTVTGKAHAFWRDDDSVDADTSICGRASRLVVVELWFAASAKQSTPDECCEGCALMLAKHGARLELPHQREAKALRRAQREADADADPDADD